MDLKSQHIRRKLCKACFVVINYNRPNILGKICQKRRAAAALEQLVNANSYYYHTHLVAQRAKSSIETIGTIRAIEQRFENHSTRTTLCIPSRRESR